MASAGEFRFQFCNFLVRCSVYIVCPTVLSCSNLKLHQMLEVKNIFFKEEKIILQLTFNPAGLTLTGFRTTRPSWVEKGTVRVKYLAQEYNTMFPVRAQIQTAQS